MRPIELSLPFNRLARMLASFSVRTRIVLLALIPVVGFVANGLTFTAGEGDVGRAFATVTHSTALADVSRDFKSPVASMRIIVKDFSVSPDNKLVVSFAQAHATALKALETLAASIDQSHTENIAGLRKDLMSPFGNFNELLQEQKTLGFDDASGLRKNLQVAGNAVERPRHVPVAHPNRNYRSRYRHGRDWPWFQLADRAQHHETAQWTGHGHEAACKW